MRKVLLLVACAGFVAGVVGSGCASPPPGDRMQKLAGTYKLAICRGPCGAASSRTLVTGTLVLKQGETVSDHLPNACFILTKPDERADTYAGIQRFGMARWSAQPHDSLAITLFRSPDAGYDARLAVAGDGLRGRGHSWGAGVAEVNFPDDSIQARRVGPPDNDVCLEVVREPTARY